MNNLLSRRGVWLGALVLAVCGALGAAIAEAQVQTSTGGVFQPLLSYVVEGVWTFKGAAPLKFEGATNDGIAMTIAVPDPTVAGTLTLPSATGGVPVVLDCGATGVGNQTCAPVTATAATKFYVGTSTLATNAAVITFPTAFAAITSYQCIGQDITTRANPVQMLSTSTTTATITNTTGASDVINWICAGY
jgi:hypothetical protein